MYHFIGIKGSGMSSLAIVMKKLGYDVCGSDYDKHFFTEKNLLLNGISVFPFSCDNIKSGMIIVKGNSFSDDNVEVARAKSLGLKIFSYQEMVDLITRKYDLIAVSGCHGKTTTSKLLSHVIDSSYLVGDGSGDVSDSPYFVLEACEYKRHFLSYHPKVTIITNIDLDHTDYFSSIDDVISAYQSFIEQSQIVIACGDNDFVSRVSGINYLYGIGEGNDFVARNVIYSDSGISFDFYALGEFVRHIDIPFFGKHMVLNTLAVLSVYYIEGFDFSLIDSRLYGFTGADRRFNEFSVLDNIVIDDYAHHPNEIRSVIDAARQKYPSKKLICIFEPHTFSRVMKFHKDIALELNRSDYCFIMDIYKSRENSDDYKGVTSELILDYIDNGEYLGKDDFSKLIRYRDSVLLFMSPNDLTDFEKKYMDSYVFKYR